MHTATPRAIAKHHEDGEPGCAPEAVQGEAGVVGEHASCSFASGACRGQYCGARLVGAEVGDLAVDQVDVALRAARELRVVRDQEDGGAESR